MVSAAINTIDIDDDLASRAAEIYYLEQIEPIPTIAQLRAEWRALSPAEQDEHWEDYQYACIQGVADNLRFYPILKS